MLPVITLKEEIEGQDAEELVAKCPLDVFDIEDLGGGSKRAKVGGGDASIHNLEPKSLRLLGVRNQRGSLVAARVLDTSWGIVSLLKLCPRRRSIVFSALPGAGVYFQMLFFLSDIGAVRGGGVVACRICFFGPRRKGALHTAVCGASSLNC